MNIPNEIYVYIASFLHPSVENIIQRQKCICYTKTSNFFRKCKNTAPYAFCHIHRSLAFPEIFTCLSSYKTSPKKETKRQISLFAP